MNKTHSFMVSDSRIIEAFFEVKNSIDGIAHTDAPSELELCKIRRAIGDDSEMISINWLRNQIVKLRKAARLKEDAGLEDSLV